MVLISQNSKFQKYFLNLLGLLLNFKTASLLTLSLIPENFNSIGLEVFEISHVKTLKMRKVSVLTTQVQLG